MDLVSIRNDALNIYDITRLNSKENGDAKKVSRAQSWRYEASLYVNPPSQLHHQRPVLVHPPPFPDFILPSTSSRYSFSSLHSQSYDGRDESPDSVTSSPMLRTKNNCMAEVDLVRTSLPAQRERQRMDTPPAYREPVDSLAIYPDTFR